MKKRLLERLRKLSEAQLYREMYCDPLTGLLNRTALEQDDKPFIALIDLDSLKYVNDTFGYRTGDKFLIHMAKSLVAAFGRHSVYRLSGDEFVVRTDRIRRLHKVLKEMQNEMPMFSFGTGVNMRLADHQLKANKRFRELRGLRAARGETPPWSLSSHEVINT